MQRNMGNIQSFCNYVNMKFSTKSPWPGKRSAFIQAVSHDARVPDEEVCGWPDAAKPEPVRARAD